VEPLVREQEFGNLQDEEFKSFREEQQRVGRFFYRFPTGESGADVYGRVYQWWECWVRKVNLRPGVEHADAIIVVCHGLTMRCLLMQLYGWSPNTFATIWNANNCDAYVLKLDVTQPGDSPYVLDHVEGDYPRSTLDVVVTFTDGNERTLPLDDYLSIAPPRTTRVSDAARLLAQQHGFDQQTVASIDFFAARAGFNKELVSPPRWRRASALSSPTSVPQPAG